MGEEGELAFDLVFKPLAREDGSGLFREVSDKFKLPRNQGIDRSIRLNSGRYVDFEIKTSTGEDSSFNRDQRKGAEFFVRDRLGKIAKDPSHPAYAEAKARLKSSSSIEGYAVMFQNALSTPSKINVEIRQWDTHVGWKNSTRASKGWTRI